MHARIIRTVSDPEIGAGRGVAGYDVGPYAAANQP
jgi:hypothetical protein